MSKPQKDRVVEIPENVLRHLLTASELRMLKNRWQIMQYLEEGLSIRGIAKKIGVGTDTVTRVARMLEKSGLRKVMGKDKSNLRTIKSQTPWIFGKNN